MFKKKTLITVIAICLVVAGLAFGAIKIAKADDANNQQSLVQRLAQKLNLNESKVSTAMDQIRTEDQEARLAKMKEKLEQAVKDGVITEEQKQKILDKQTEMQQNREKMQTWEEENDIDMSKLRDYGIDLGMGGGRGHGGPMGEQIKI